MSDHDDPEQPVSELPDAEPAAQGQPADYELRPNEPGKTVCISERKLEANRRNGVLGGVKTEEGKRRSRRNALKHGMRATTLLVDDDGSSEGQKFRELRDALEQEFKPRTTTEYMLVDKMALALLRTRSGRAHEHRELSMDSAFQFPAIDRLVRYSNAADKLFFVALAELQKLRAEDVKEEDTDSR
jgi:hypothetical protein